MKRYDIADWLRPEWARAICRATYDQPGKDDRQRLTDGGQCPLGVLARDGVLEYCANPSAPDGQAFALAYSRLADFLDDAELKECAKAATEFIDDWDTGKIKPDELPYVLGVIDWPQSTHGAMVQAREGE